MDLARTSRVYRASRQCPPYHVWHQFLNVRSSNVNGEVLLGRAGRTAKIASFNESFTLVPATFAKMNSSATDVTSRKETAEVLESLRMGLLGPSVRLFFRIGNEFPLPPQERHDFQICLLFCNEPKERFTF